MNVGLLVSVISVVGIAVGTTTGPDPVGTTRVATWTADGLLAVAFALAVHEARTTYERQAGAEQGVKLTVVCNGYKPALHKFL